MIILHNNEPRLILYNNKELLMAGEKIWQYFLEFCLRRKPLPMFEQISLEKNQRAAINYFADFFTEEKDLVLRVSNNELSGFVLFDPQSYTLTGADDSCVELVIAGTLHESTWQNIKDAKKLIAAYENYKGRSVAMNIQRAFKSRGFKRFCEKVGFKNIKENAYVFEQ